MTRPAYIQAAQVQNGYLHLGLRYSMDDLDNPNGFPVSVTNAQGRVSHFVPVKVGRESETLFKQMKAENLETIRQECQKEKGRVPSLENQGLRLGDDAFEYYSAQGDRVEPGSAFAKGVRFGPMDLEVFPYREFRRDRNDEQIQERLALKDILAQVGDHLPESTSAKKTPEKNRGMEFE